MEAGMFKKDLICQHSFAVWFQISLPCMPFIQNFYQSKILFWISKRTTLNWILKYYDLTPNTVLHRAKIYQFKADDSELTAYLLFLGNILKDFSVDNMKETLLNGCIHNFSVAHYSIDVDDILVSINI